MKCPNCGYVSHDYLDACRKCQSDWATFKQQIHLLAPEPGDLDVSIPANENAGQFGSSGSFSVDDSLFSAQTLLVEREEEETPEDTEDNVEAEDHFDPELIDDDAAGEFTGKRTDATQDAGALETDIELTERSDVLNADEEPESIDVVALDISEWSTADSMPSQIDVIDMSDLQELDDVRLDDDESVVSDPMPDAPLEIELEVETAGDEPPSSETRPADTGPELVLDAEEFELEEDDEKSS